jgi:hypothetical protein
MNDTKTAPALTAEGWEHKEFAVGNTPKREKPGHTLFGYIKSETGALHLGWDGDLCLPVQDTHPLAALALYGQPFGFTREDVAELRGAIDDVESNILEGGSFESIRLLDRHEHPTILCLRSLADRIEARLPPESA